MADVVANDTMPGAVTPEDRLALARSQVDANDLISAEKTLVGLKESEMQNLDLDAQASYAALFAISSPGRGKPRFAGLRPALMSAQLATTSRLDILRSALTLGDHELADHQAKALLEGEEAKKSFGAMRKQYALHGREQDFRNIQKRVALKRIQHDRRRNPARPGRPAARARSFDQSSAASTASARRSRSASRRAAKSTCWLLRQPGPGEAGQPSASRMVEQAVAVGGEHLVIGRKGTVGRPIGQSTARARARPRPA